MVVNKAILIMLLPCICIVTNAQGNPVSWGKTLAENPFFADSEFDLSARNMWKYLKTENRYDNEERRYKTQVQQAWGQNLTIDYNSGYFADIIGFNASWYSGIKLGASEDFASRAIFYNDDGKAKGYNKVGQRYAKLKFDLDPMKVNVKSGWFTLKNTGIFTNSQRISLNSYLGWYANAAIDNLHFDALYLDGKIMRRDSPNIQRMYFRDGNGNSRDINHVMTGEASYITKELKAWYFYGQADDLFRQQGLETSYRPMPSLTLASQIYNQEYGADGRRTLDSSARGKQNYDKHAWHFAGKADWRIPQTPWTLSTGLSYTDAKKTGGVGQLARNPIGNSRGRFNSPAYSDIDYVRDGETMVALAAEYKLSKALSVGVRSNYSLFSYQGETLRQGQLGVFSYWKPIKNLSIASSMGVGWHHEQESDYTTPKLYDGHSQRAHSLSGSVTTTYYFNRK